MTPFSPILHLSVGTKSQPLNNFLKTPKREKKEYEYICRYMNIYVCIMNEYTVALYCNPDFLLSYQDICK